MKKQGKTKRVIFGIREDECIWMKAGVVNFKLCHNAFDCTTCSFDRAMQKALSQGKKTTSWRDEMMRKPHSERACRYMMSGDVPVKYCSNAYDCSTCEFDQLMQAYHETIAGHEVKKSEIQGFTVADDYYYHPGHSWLRYEHGGLIRIGIDDFSHRLLGFISEIRLPEVGTKVKENTRGWLIRRDEKIAPFLMPVEGIVVARNHRVMQSPSLVKDDPYEEGWLIMLEPIRKLNAQGSLFYGEEAKNFFREEANKLDAMVQEVYGGMSLAATGGEVINDIYGNLKRIGWDTLVKKFLLRTEE